MNALDETLATVQQPQGGNALDQTLAAIQTPQPTPGPLAWWERVAKGVTDVNDAGAQMLVNAMPAPVVNAVNSATKAVNDLPVIGPITKALNMTPATAQDVNNTIAKNEQAYQARRGDSGVDWARALGSIATTLPLSPAMGATGVGGGALAGALYSGVSSPITEGDYASGKIKQMGVGAVTGGATSLGAEVLARAISPKVAPQAQQLLDEGVTLTPGQIMGGGFKRAEDAASSIPILGDTIKNAQRRSFMDLNATAVNRSLDPIGEKLPAGVTGREAIDYAKTKLADAYDAALSKMGAIRPDAQFGQDLGSLSSLTHNLPQQTSDQFQRILQNEVLQRIDQNGVMTPQAMKAAESNLGSMASGYLKSPDYDTRMLGTAVQQAQATLRSMVQRVAPADASAQLQAANAGWANFLRVQRASSSLGAESGAFTPEQLQSAIKAMDSSRNKGAFATGDALMQDLSESAKNVMGNKVPDSGTPYRHAIELGVGALIGHSAFPAETAAVAIPGAVAGGAAMLPYTPMGQKLAAALLTSRPAGAKLTADEIRSLAPLLLPAVAAGSK